MRAGEAEKRPSAGISAAEDADLVALYERLREQLRRGSSPGGDGSELAATRALAERYRPVTAERELGGGPKALAKRVLRKLMRWYVEPLAADQRVFNDATLKLVDALSERADAMAVVSERAERLLREVEERLTRLERRERTAEVGAPPVTVAAQPAAAAFPDYFAFESRMRGSVEGVRERQRRYVDDFRAQAPVLDIGCGRGELVALLRDAGIEARGIDADADMIAYARGEGLAVDQADAVSYLEGLPEESLGGIFMGQVVEHLPAPTLVRTLELAVQALRPGGVLVAETINPLSPIALRNYFADLTHAQPLVPETLALLAQQAGFASVETRFLNPPPRPEGVSKEVADLLFAPLDYAVVARR